MHSESITEVIFLVFVGSVVLATIALYARQVMIVAYILAGALIGPLGLGLITDTSIVQQASNIGIMFLLFLLGLDLSPIKLIKLFRSMVLVTGLSSTTFGLLGFAFAYMMGLPMTDSIILCFAMMFSSTIIGIKLLPTTALHHKPIGEVIISILLLQDLIALGILITMHSMASHTHNIAYAAALLFFIVLPAFILICYLIVRWLVGRLLARFDRFKEYTFLLAIGWCLGVAEAAELIGFSYESGAFIAGITLAASPLAPYIAESLKPVRDFFLVIFFFSLGAEIQPQTVQELIYPALLLAAGILILKPLVFKWMINFASQHADKSTEVGVRLGQGSEFSLLIAALAWTQGLITVETKHLIQLACILSFLVSPYWVILRYPSPLGLSEKLRRD